MAFKKVPEVKKPILMKTDIFHNTKKYFATSEHLLAFFFFFYWFTVTALSRDWIKLSKFTILNGKKKKKSIMLIN